MKTFVKVKNEKEFNKLMDAYEKYTDWKWAGDCELKDFSPYLCDGVYNYDIISVYFGNDTYWTSYIEPNTISLKTAIKRLKKMSGTNRELYNHYGFDLEAVLKDPEPKYKAAKSMKEHYKEMYEAASGEHTFANMQIGLLESIIDEIYEITDEEIVKAVIENGKNRRELDKIIHSKKVFNL